MTENEIGTKIISAAFQVHKEIGPGLLEKSYQIILTKKLQEQGLKVQSEKAVPLVYDGKAIETTAYYADIVVENKVLIEVKAVESIAPVHLKQTLTYLKMLNFELGYILNFNVALMKQGIKRVIRSKT